MRFFLLILLVALCLPAQAETVVVRGRSTVITGSAQDAAVVLARRGALVHTGCSQVEGIGFSSVSEQRAISNCCFWGKRKAIDVGVARGARGWYAVVRYQ